MTLDEKMLEQLQNWEVSDDRRSKIFSFGDWKIHVTANRCDELGCKAWELAFHREPPAKTRQTLAAWANNITQRATGLLESLRVWEIDADRNEGFLRSDMPTIRDGKRHYFEIHLSGITKATVRRYQSEGTAKREQIPFTLTHETLAKLAADVAAE